MKKIIILFIFTCVLLIPDIRDCFGQTITWQRLYEIEGDNRSVSKATCHADSGNFYSGGTAFLGGNWRIFVMKINPYGDTIWTKRIDTLGSEVFAMTESGDGGCVIVGDNNYTIKLSSTGSIVWAKNYGGSGVALFDLIKTTDGGYIACGEHFDISNFVSNGYLLKVDVNGNMEWQQIYPTGDWKILQSVMQLPNGIYVLTGSDSDFFGDTVKALFLKVNGLGTIILDEEYKVLGKGANGFKIDYVNNQFLLGGATSDSTGQKTNAYIMRLDTNGNILYVKKYEANRNEGFYDMKVINSNKFVFTRTRSIGITLDSYTMIIDTLGNEITGKSFALPLFVNFRSILLMPNGDFIFAGNGNNSQQSEYDTYIVRTDSLLYAPPIAINNLSGNLPSDYFLKQNYPNPFNPVTIIEFQMKKAANIKILIYDVTGKFLKTIVNKKLSTGVHKVEFAANGYASGVYFYSIIVNGDLKETRKMMLIK